MFQPLMLPCMLRCKLALAIAVGLFTLAGPAAAARAKEERLSIHKSPFGQTADGQDVELYTLANEGGLVVKVMTYGGIITSVQTPDRKGKLGEITLGFDSLEDYLKGHPFFGALCGRVANRIAKGKFTIEGREYQVAVNNGVNHLHGGIKGFDKVVWKAKAIERPGEVALELQYVSADGEEGYPGALSTKVTYALTAANELRIAYEATTDKTTTLNLTNHTYWNLADGGASDVLSHELTLAADQFLPVDDGAIPTGELASVAATPMDFTKSTTIGKRIDAVPGAAPGGYDHCYVVRRKRGGSDLTLAARVVEPKSGRVMEVHTTEPGVQLYTGNFLDGSLKSRGATFGKRHGFCLETQHFPDAVNQPKFATTLLKPGETYKSTTVHKFSTSK
jgi:aldose 1-epimerase